MAGRKPRVKVVDSEGPAHGYDLHAPTPEYVLALRSELETQFRRQDEQIDTLREVRELQRAVVLDDDYRLVAVEVRVPTIAAEIFRYTARLALNPPTLTVTAPPNSGDSGAENATLRERATEEILRECGSRMEGPDTLSLAVDALVGDGGTVTKLLFSADLWENRYRLDDLDTVDAAQEYERQSQEAKREAGPPFVWAHVDVRTFYPLFSGGQFSAVLEVQKRPTSSVFRKYRLKQDLASGEIVPVATGQPVPVTESMAGATVDVVEYWDDEWCCYIVDQGKDRDGGRKGYPLTAWRHGYGQIPYFWAPGRWMNHWRNRKVGWSVSEPKRWLVEYLSYLLTLHAQVAARDALPPATLEVPDTAAPLVGKDGKPITSEKWRPGQIRVGRPGEKLNVLQFPQTAAEFEKHIAVVQAMVDKLETPRVTNEIGADGNGFNTSLVLSEVRTDEDPLAQSLERALKRVAQFVWRLIREKLREKVWVGSGKGGWVGLGPDDLQAGVALAWQMNPERPTAKLVENRYWSERLKNRTAHRHQAIEALGDNPDEVEDGLAMDDLRASSEYQLLRRQRIFQKVARGDLLQQTAALQRLRLARAGMVPGVAGAPVGAGAVSPSMGSQQVPDMGNLTVSPGGAGAAPQPGTPGPTAGAPVVPQQAGAAGIQALGR